jgi:hypothetical protein
LIFQIYSDGEPNGSPTVQTSKSDKGRVASIKLKLIDTIIKCSSKLKPFLSWVKKNINKRIKCYPYKKKNMVCVSDLKLGKKVIPVKVWLRVPGFIRRRLTGPQYETFCLLPPAKKK